MTLPLGGLWGFVIMGMWSVGLFYAYGAVVLLVAVVIHLIGVRVWRNLFTVWFWLVMGASSVPVLLLVLDSIRARTNGYVTTDAPASVFGCFVFAGTLALAALGGIGRRLLRPSSS